MTDESGLLTAVRAAPDDDLVRLAYADWLDENGRTAHAAFVRLQIEAARVTLVDPSTRCTHDERRRSSRAGRPHRTTCRWCRFVARCDRNALPILRRVARAWADPGVRAAVLPAAGLGLGRHVPSRGLVGGVQAVYPDNPYGPVTVGVRRGFVDSVTCGVFAFLGSGSRRPGAWAVVRAHPVRTVRIDSLPQGVRTVRNLVRVDCRRDLPKSLFDLLRDGTEYVESGTFVVARDYTTVAAMTADVSAACVAFARDPALVDAYT